MLVLIVQACVRIEVAVLGRVRPNEPSGFRGREAATLNHANALVSACP